MKIIYLALMCPNVVTGFTFTTHGRCISLLAAEKNSFNADAPWSRRGILSITAASSLLLLSPEKSLAKSDSLAYLEPLFELQVFVDGVQEQISSKKYSDAKKELKALFSGETSSELESSFMKYAQLSLEEEDPDEIPELRNIQQDTQSAALDGCFKHLRRLEKILEESPPDEEQAKLEINFAAADMQRWYDALGSDERR